jgi:hypothetical protein
MIEQGLTSDAVVTVTENRWSKDRILQQQTG